LLEVARFQLTTCSPSVARALHVSSNSHWFSFSRAKPAPEIQWPIHAFRPLRLCFSTRIRLAALSRQIAAKLMRTSKAQKG
jgi:hypothetical protein